MCNVLQEKKQKQNLLDNLYLDWLAKAKVALRGISP